MVLAGGVPTDTGGPAPGVRTDTGRAQSGARLSFTMGRRRVPKLARVGTPPHSGARLSYNGARPPGVPTPTPAHGGPAPVRTVSETCPNPSGTLFKHRRARTAS